MGQLEAITFACLPLLIQMQGSGVAELGISGFPGPWIHAVYCLCFSDRTYNGRDSNNTSPRTSSPYYSRLSRGLILEEGKNHQPQKKDQKEAFPSQGSEAPMHLPLSQQALPEPTITLLRARKLHVPHEPSSNHAVRPLSLSCWLANAVPRWHSDFILLFSFNFSFPLCRLVPFFICDGGSVPAVQGETGPTVVSWFRLFQFCLARHAVTLLSLSTSGRTGQDMGWTEH